MKTPSQTFRSAINEGLQAFWILGVDHVHESGIDPSPCLYRVKTTNNEVELHVVVFALVLNFPIIAAIQLSVVECMERVTYGVTLTPGTRAMMNSAATIALGLPTSFDL
jgi:hypothetical protein